MHLSGQNVRGFDPIDGDNTPLHIAAANGHVELVRYLVDHAEVKPCMMSPVVMCPVFLVARSAFQGESSDITKNDVILLHSV
jgi:ankyrin repeat protein